jgi:predicted nucleic acid-binding Zn ribbon protein
MTGHAEQRPCPACGTIFTWTPASPRQRFCSTRCRQSWWDRRRRQATAALNRAAAPPAASGPHDDAPRAGGHDAHGDGPRGRDAAATLTAAPACPHCRQPVAIVAWLVPPAAASVATPPRHADANP